ncbi:MAG: sulfite exporter TauE/SafE family protein, partial [Eudoraea sp.]|nr:sulfite exporter TauE/SafE family protein [Eudoraea sp.]
TALFHLSSNITKIGFFRKGFDKKMVLNLGIPAVLFVIVGAYLSKFVDPHLLNLILGGFLLGFGLTFLLAKELRFEASKRNAIIGGALSGGIAGLLGTGGAIRGATMTAFDLTKEKFIATSAIIDLGIDLSRSVVYTYNGYVHLHDFYLIPILIGVSIIGTYLGKKVLDEITHLQFKRFVLFLLIGIGVLTLIFNINKYRP